MEIFQWIQTISLAFTAIGVMIGVITFRKNQRIKRAEWLTKLYEKFYEENNHKEVRKWIDFNLLDKELMNDADHKKEEKLADYLNFFEFIGTLERMGQLKVEEIQLLFAYYLNLLKHDAKCMQYIKANKFKNLGNLLNKIKENE